VISIRRPRHSFLKRVRIALDQSYADEATAVVEEQLAKAGYRLAYFLGLSLKN
jgi:hypothetical protein